MCEYALWRHGLDSRFWGQRTHWNMQHAKQGAQINGALDITASVDQIQAFVRPGGILAFHSMPSCCVILSLPVWQWLNVFAMFCSTFSYLQSFLPCSLMWIFHISFVPFPLWMHSALFLLPIIYHFLPTLPTVLPYSLSGPTYPTHLLPFSTSFLLLPWGPQIGCHYLSTLFIFAYRHIPVSQMYSVLFAKFATKIHRILELIRCSDLQSLPKHKQAVMNSIVSANRNEPQLSLALPSSWMKLFWTHKYSVPYFTLFVFLLIFCFIPMPFCFLIVKKQFLTRQPGKQNSFFEHHSTEWFQTHCFHLKYSQCPCTPLWQNTYLQHVFYCLPNQDSNLEGTPPVLRCTSLGLHDLSERAATPWKAILTKCNVLS